ncbi:hypothetical protein N9Y92_03425 [Chlamydiales bacterium]|nr:hypothetical protein [Chlamydiales bacterium]
MERELPIERKALFNLIQMQWHQNPSAEVKEWQIEDLREFELSELLDRLQQQELWLDKKSFLAFSEKSNTPEDLTEQLVGDRDLSSEEVDQIYLLLFELWRRFLPEKQSLTLFCDTLDHLIIDYDRGEVDNTKSIQETLKNLLLILHEGLEAGHEPLEVFETVATRCANDIESFLFDFISEMIDEGDVENASELVDGFSQYVSDLKWFQFLKCRLLSQNDPTAALDIVSDLVQEARSEPDTHFLFELLCILVEIGNDSLFFPIVTDLVSKVKFEDQFQEVLQITYEYFQRQDRDPLADQIEEILIQRESLPLTAPFNKNDPLLKKFYSIIQQIN